MNEEAIWNKDSHSYESFLFPDVEWVYIYLALNTHDRYYSFNLSYDTIFKRKVAEIVR